LLHASRASGYGDILEENEACRPPDPPGLRASPVPSGGMQTGYANHRTGVPRAVGVVANVGWVNAGSIYIPWVTPRRITSGYGSGMSPPEPSPSVRLRRHEIQADFSASALPALT
jgi:hypothetical protein